MFGILSPHRFDEISEAKVYQTYGMPLFQSSMNASNVKQKILNYSRSQFFSFDTENGLWQTCRPLPFGLAQYAAIEFNGKIYVVGRNWFFCYDPISDEWSEKARIAVHLAGTDVKFAKSNEHLYTINSNGIVSRYYANQDQWTTVIEYIECVLKANFIGRLFF